MKKIIISEKQLVKFLKLNETIQQYVNKKPGETIDNAIKTAAREIATDAPNADIDFVVPKEEVNEEYNDVNNVENICITKKKIKENLKNKRISESKIITKKEFKNKLK